MPQTTSRGENGQFWEASWEYPGEDWSVVYTDKGVQLESNGRIYPPDFVPPPLEITQSRKQQIRTAQRRLSQRMRSNPANTRSRLGASPGDLRSGTIKRGSCDNRTASLISRERRSLNSFHSSKREC
jgi:hypothetical protein